MPTPLVMRYPLLIAAVRLVAGVLGPPDAAVVSPGRANLCTGRFLDLGSWILTDALVGDASSRRRRIEEGLLHSVGFFEA